MKNRRSTFFIGVFVSLLVVLSGCETKHPVEILGDGTTSQVVTPKPSTAQKTNLEEKNQGSMDFSVALLKNSIIDGKNNLISPFSLLSVLGMTANGADKETLLQMESLWGMDIESLNKFLEKELEGLSKYKGNKLHVANSIWIKESNEFKVNSDFLDKSKNHYNGSIHQVPFNNKTLEEMNRWVSEHTGETIENIINEIDENGIMYLINALLFEGEWETTYTQNQIETGKFTTENGEVHEAEFMYSQEEFYLEDKSVTGFRKPYKTQRYDFVALLPKEGLEIADYVNGLTGVQLEQVLNPMENIYVDVKLPEFKSGITIDMSHVLKFMGMENAFHMENADFTKMGSSAENIYINQVLHKIYIEVTPQGTKAGAGTVVEMTEGAASEVEVEVERKQVYLDRPFIYMIIDNHINMPIFIGTTMEIL